MKNSSYAHQLLHILRIGGLALMAGISILVNAQEPEILWGPERDIADYLGIVEGQSDEHLFLFTEKDVSEAGNVTKSIGVINVLSIDGLDLVSSFELTVPLHNSDAFTVEKFIVIGRDLRLIYSYFSKQDEMKRVAIVDFSPEGEILRSMEPLISSSGQRESRTFDIQVMTNSATGCIAIIHGEHLIGFHGSNIFTSELEVIVIDRELQPIHRQIWQLGEDKFYNIEQWTCDRNGNLYFSLEETNRTLPYPRKHLITTIDITSRAIHYYTRPEDLDKWCNPIYASRFFETPEGDMVHYRPYAHVKADDSLNGAILSTFSSNDTQLKRARSFPFPVNYPRERKDHGTSVQRFDAGGIELTSEGHVRTIGYVSDYKGNGLKFRPGFVAYEFSPADGFVGLWECVGHAETDRGHNSGLHADFLLERSHAAVLFLELPENIGAQCGAVTSWNMKEWQDAPLIPTCVVFKNGRFSPRHALLPDLGKVDEVTLVRDLGDGRALLSVRNGRTNRYGLLTWR